jgi:sialate O-acetylesterase
MSDMSYLFKKIFFLLILQPCITLGRNSILQSWNPLSLRSPYTSQSNGVTYDILSNTYLSSGDDLFNSTLSVIDAENLCSSLSACVGFTYNSATPTTRVDMTDPTFVIYLKSSLSSGSGVGWISYLKVEQLILSSTFSDSMVLQFDSPCLWGYGDNRTGAAVTVTTDADGGLLHSTTVQENNTWSLCLPKMTYGGPWTLTVSVDGFGNQTINDLLFGSVWIGSGQSNFAFATSQAFNATAECAAANYSNIRVMTVAQGGSAEPHTDFGPNGIRAKWARATPLSICGGGDFDYTSAVGYFFARDLHLATNLPIGLIVTSVPGTPIEAWVSPRVLAACNISINNSQLWNNMVVPLLQISIAGAIFFQGESNTGDDSYACSFPGLIVDWRMQWRMGLDFTFIFTQLSPYYNENPSTCLAEGGPGIPLYQGMLPKARLRQEVALSLPNVGMASAIDIADPSSPFWPGSVHPRWKQPIGYRMSLEARRINFGETNLISRGPQLKSITAFDGCKYDYSCGSYHQKDALVLRLVFTSVGEGLVVSNFAVVSFLASFNNATAPLNLPCRVPGSIVPMNSADITDSIDVYITGDEHCTGGTTGILYLMGLFDSLFFDVPVVTIKNSVGLPMEPFSVNITTNGRPIPDSGLPLWP